MAIWLLYVSSVTPRVALDLGGRQLANLINVYRGAWTSLDIREFEFESHPTLSAI